MDFENEAKEIVRQIAGGKLSDCVLIIEKGLKDAYNLGKKHLLEPHHLKGETKIVPERDTQFHK